MIGNDHVRPGVLPPVPYRDARGESDNAAGIGGRLGNGFDRERFTGQSQLIEQDAAIGQAKVRRHQLPEPYVQYMLRAGASAVALGPTSASRRAASLLLNPSESREASTKSLTCARSL